ncbi:MAG: EF-P lysine aminoacylase EpmA [Gammaproteobacteria bacterium]|nr:EF-P lysine aminoacylase EpmA [Gammaproteobacteria bacterium]
MGWRPTATIESLRHRARIYRRIRAFFEAREFLEVDTPLLSGTTNTDAQIASMRAHNQGQELYLQTSPEFAMKRLLAAGSGSIYQICHAFREAEKGRRHQPEFTLLEWYRIGYDYHALMDQMENLIDLLSERTNSFQRRSYRNILIEHTDVDINSIQLPALRTRTRELVPGTDTSTLDFDQCLDLLISMVVSPGLQGYVFVYDYPVSQAALARVSAINPMVAERFELFYNDLELANGFSELIDAKQQRRRFELDNSQRQAKGLPQYPVDEQLLAALESGMPECAGVALGLDRLLMVLQGLDCIDQTLSFPH